MWMLSRSRNINRCHSVSPEQEAWSGFKSNKLSNKSNLQSMLWSQAWHILWAAICCWDRKRWVENEWLSEAASSARLCMCIKMRGWLKALLIGLVGFFFFVVNFSQSAKLLWNQCTKPKQKQKTQTETQVYNEPCVENIYQPPVFAFSKHVEPMMIKRPLQRHFPCTVYKLWPWLLHWGYYCKSCLLLCVLVLYSFSFFLPQESVLKPPKCKVVSNNQTQPSPSQ